MMHVYTLVVLLCCLLVTCSGFIPVPIHCNVKGHMYLEEIIQNRDPCAICYCLGYQDIHCFERDHGCTPPTCDNPLIMDGQCCEVCPEPCIANSVTYDIGDIYVDNDLCEDCTCTEFGPKCGPLKCPVVNCIDPVHKQGECCPVCPNGPNCGFGRRLISVGDVFSPRRGITCSCTTDPWEPIACCKKAIGDRKAARILKRKSDILNPVLLQVLKTN